MSIEIAKENRQKVAIIGTSGSGKTCFIAAMRWLGERDADARFISVGANGDSKRYLDDLHEAIIQGGVPPGTPKEFRLDFSERYVADDGKDPVQIDFSVRDFKGGELHDLDADSPLLQSWAECNLLMVLLDIEKVQKQGVELQNNLRDLSAVLMRDEMDATGKRLAIVITQADKGGYSQKQHSVEDAEKFVKNNMPTFFERIRTCGFNETKCFLLASIGLNPEEGTDGDMRVPEVDGVREWRPFGYEKIFDWVCDFQLHDQRERMWANFRMKTKPFVAVLAVLAVGVVIWQGVVVSRQHGAKGVYDSLNSSLEERAAATQKMSEENRIGAIEERIKDYKVEVESFCDERKLRDLFSDSRKFFGKAKLSEEQRNRVREIDSNVSERIEDFLHARIKDAMERREYNSASKLIAQYRDDQVIARKHQKDVNEYRDEIQDGILAEGKRAIATYSVGDAGNISRMRKKLDMISGFNYPDKEDREAAQRAVLAMGKLMGGVFSIEQINASGLGEKRETYILIETGVAPNKDLKQYAEDGEGLPVKTKIVDSVLPQWNDERMGDRRDLSWTPGQSIKVEWRRVCAQYWWGENYLGDSCKASLTYMNDWLGLLRILQPHAPMSHVDYGNFKDDPAITIKCKEFPDAKKDLELIERYVYPGTYWTE